MLVNIVALSAFDTLPCTLASNAWCNHLQQGSTSRLPHEKDCRRKPILQLRGGAYSTPSRARYISDTGEIWKPKPARSEKKQFGQREMSDAERVYVVEQFVRPELRKRFLARVYGIVSVQVALVAAMISLVRSTPVLTYHLFRRAPLLLLIAWIPAFWLQLSPDRSRRAPGNYVLLLLFTLLTGLGLGAATAFVPHALMVRAGGATLVATLALSVYAMRTPRDFTLKGGMLASAVLALLALGLLQAFVGGSILSTAQAYLGVVVFSAYLVYDTQRMVGGDKAVQLRPDEHVLGALTIFTDLLNLFLYILRALAADEPS